MMQMTVDDIITLIHHYIQVCAEIHAGIYDIAAYDMFLKRKGKKKQTAELTNFYFLSHVN